MLIIENGTVYTPGQVIPDGVVFIDDGHIQAVARRGERAIPYGAQRLDARDGSITPGLIDMHMHGLHGYDTMDGKAASVLAMSSILPRYGVTSFVPTTLTATLESIDSALKAVQEAQHTETQGAEILGVHVEGPYVCAQERGAHRADLLRNPSAEDYPVFWKYGDLIRSFTLAPELPGSLDLIRQLKKRGILISAGHSIAVESEIERAVDAGMSHVTHMFGNMSSLRRQNLRRVAGLVEYTLLDDRLTTEIIGDGFHISPCLTKLILKQKGPEHLAVVTDASPLTGLPPGKYHTWGIDIVKEEKIAFVADHSAYAGTVATLDQCLARVIENADTTFRDALRMVTLTPATILNVAHRKGSLEAGKDADVVILDSKLNVTQTIVAGKVAFTGA
jgi:N-acetylglucosamine-6-phosphate deacetylase